MSYQSAIALMDRGPAKPTLFSVRLPNTYISRETNDYLDFFCQTTAIPEIRHNSIKLAGHENMGIVRDQPTAIIYAKPFTIDVIADAEMETYREMREWFDATAINANQALQTGRTQKMTYYSSYAKNMELIKLEQASSQRENESEREDKLEETMRVTFINAYPIGVGRIGLDSAAADQILKFQVSFTYESYTVSYDGLDSQRVPSGLV